MHHKLLRLIHLLEDGLLIVTLGTMILLALSQIILRNLFDTGIEWTDPLLRVLVLWLGLLGAIAATRQNRHITIDVVSRLLPLNGQRITSVISNLFSAAVCAVISYYAARFVMMEYEDGLTAFADVPAWLCESIIPLGFGLMALRFLINTGGVIKRGPPAATKPLS
ncbi:C4-dicarboxylate ABC transporter permease [Candidatus Tenderia electrophaga]|jgi:TRAP-type C4-dicarboxylate transport system permease small subunit|uniref:TRAP transporter small permease protein n=1 Tax=Candidatus Tenderia electrophaga TaxID=1748243 RepID=A0A0S2TD77_9GAMM|nr:C4-dicarboxylate ABC transporter permease [Candidatus Tenderia electrophaga]